MVRRLFLSRFLVRISGLSMRENFVQAIMLSIGINDSQKEMKDSYCMILSTSFGIKGIISTVPLISNKIHSGNLCK